MVRRSPRPGIHPGPPDDLARRDLPLVSIPGPLFRVHRTRHAPLYFGKTGDNRFDDPRREYGVLYAGATEACAFIETFGEPLEIPFVTRAQVDARKLSEIEIVRPIRLVNLAGADLRRVGADARLFAGHHSVAQRWSRALHDHPGLPDGIRYPARHDPDEFAVALFDRARRSVRARVASELLGAASQRAKLARLLDRYGIGLV
jgi:RES domain